MKEECRGQIVWDLGSMVSNQNFILGETWTSAQCKETLLGMRKPEFLPGSTICMCH